MNHSFDPSSPSYDVMGGDGAPGSTAGESPPAAQDPPAGCAEAGAPCPPIVALAADAIAEMATGGSGPRVEIVSEAEERLKAQQTHEKALLLKRGLSVLTYQLAVLLKLVRDEKMFLLLDQPYETWTDYCDNAMQIGYRQITKWIRVVGRFDEEQVRRYGVEKLNLLLNWCEAMKIDLPADLSIFTLGDPSGTPRLFGELSASQAEEGFRVQSTKEPEAPVTPDETAFGQLVEEKLREMSSDVSVKVRQGKNGARMRIEFDMNHFHQVTHLLPEQLAELVLPERTPKDE